MKSAIEKIKYPKVVTTLISNIELSLLYATDISLSANARLESINEAEHYIEQLRESIPSLLDPDQKKAIKVKCASFRRQLKELNASYKNEASGAPETAEALMKHGLFVADASLASLKRTIAIVHATRQLATGTITPQVKKSEETVGCVKDDLHDIDQALEASKKPIQSMARRSCTIS